MLDSLFPPPEGMVPANLFWIFVCYGYVLFLAANLLSDGSELLLFIPQLAGLVGSIVLPVLGAVPDGMMVLFSGMGPVEKAQESVAVGVGALAGSTIMLLTVPWFLAVLGGRVDIDASGKCAYSEENKLTRTGFLETLLHTGIGYKDEIRANAKIMFITSLTYLIIQLPSLCADDQSAGHIPLDEIRYENKRESTWAMLAFLICVIEFGVYLYMQYVASLPEEAVYVSSAQILVERASGFVGWVKDKISGAGIIPTPNRGYLSAIVKAQERGIRLWMADFRKQWKLEDDNSKNKALLDKHEFTKEFKETLTMWHKKYTSADSGRITVANFDMLLRDLGLDGSVDAKQLFAKVDANHDGTIDRVEFQECFKILASLPPSQTPQRRRKAIVTQPAEEEEEEEEEESMPEEWQHLEPAEQKRQILLKACYQMGLGTLLVLIFSDPMVDVLGEIGKQSGIPAFYISFVLAPLASNSSELVAAYNYAQKKTSKTITISLSTLEGAACMNNTFCLGIFMALVYFQGLAWKFTAETISILAVQMVMALIVLSGNKQRLLQGLVVLGLFPGALALVYCLENYAGLD
eukprot:TRINITY_DN1450_c2_g1_i1.p1 TRINITY_DN1450_c2_g1~~TRINITY_DN1450_c2_g1_i1.p1  ORF type:complete len:596 (+),score=112.64 TRINITY_DN1450_c2_g1_i1:57-1790(+)